jgi:CCR4-NOT transcription complex subunit 1
MTSVDTLVNATEKEGIQLVEPPENVVEKVSFLFNNLSQSNLPKKVASCVPFIAVMGNVQYG